MPNKKIIFIYLSIIQGEVGCFRLDLQENSGRISEEFRKNSTRIPEEFRKNPRKIPEEFQKNIVLSRQDVI